MTTPEGKIEKHFKKEVEASGGKVRKLQWIGKSGAPDRLVWWPPHENSGVFRPRMGFVEVKAPGKKPTKVQLIEHEALRDDGFTVLVIDSIETADKAIACIRDGALGFIDETSEEDHAAAPAPVKPWAPPPKQPDLPKAQPLQQYYDTSPDNDDLI